MSEGGSVRRVIDGRFELEARLGGGGMGTVWRARDLVLDRVVALKEVRPPDPTLAEYDPQAAALLRARVLREARALARVDHPNVVTIHHVVDAGEGTYPWLVMELVTGGSLADRLARGPMEPRDAARLGRDVLAALRAAHEAGVEHRDVKPANVLLRPDGRPVLTDFGIAAVREATALTATGSVIGTPDYMAPERVSGGEGGPGADLWSLAMMLYVAVEGRHPLRRASTLATLAAVLNEPLPPPERAGALTPLLTAVLVKDPAARPGPAAVDAMLAEAAQDGPPAAGAPSGPGPGPGPAAAAVPAGTPGPAAGAGATATSYPLAPPAAGGPGATTASASVRDAVPGRPAPGPGPSRPVPGGDPGRPVPDGRGPRHPSGVSWPGKRRWFALGASVTVSALAVTLLWTFLPDGDSADAGDRGGGPAATAPGGSTPGTSTPDPSASSTASGTGTAPTARTEDTDLLTPAGIRSAVQALKTATGTDRMSSFVVYSDHASASVMVAGSKTRYDNWTYRPGEGARKGIISGTVTPLESPFDIDDLDWDAVPALLKQADKVLNVKEVSSRYVDVRAPNPTWDTPLGMAVYLSNKYHESGYLEATARGRVTRTMPNDKD
ncbi:serine/threonine-protein kinase [Streptomyces sp. NPDC018057]|uniref:serine/threonine-protein kinase n=1 Tax=unclassified Streptomyces TaxID=2593676 RepID=UPI0037B46C6D